MRDTTDSSSPNDRPKKLTLDVVKEHIQKGLERSQDPQYKDDPYKGLDASERDKKVIDDFTAILRNWQAKSEESGIPHASINDLQVLSKPLLIYEQEAWTRNPSRKSTDITVNMYHRQPYTDQAKQQELQAWGQWLADQNTQGPWAQYMKKRIQEWMPYKDHQWQAALEATYDEILQSGRFAECKQEQYNTKCLKLYHKRYNNDISCAYVNGKILYEVSTKVKNYDKCFYKTVFDISNGLIFEKLSFKKRPPLEVLLATGERPPQGRYDEEISYNETQPLNWNELLYAQMAEVERVSNAKFDPKYLYSDRIVDPKSLEIMSQLSGDTQNITLMAQSPEYNRLQSCPVVKGKIYFASLNCNKSITKIELFPHDGLDHRPILREQNGRDERLPSVQGQDGKLYKIHSALYYFR